MKRPIELIGAPVDCGKRRQGCIMGPDAYRCAGLVQALSPLGHEVTDRGTLWVDPAGATPPVDSRLHGLPETVRWTEVLSQTAFETMAKAIPVFLGGDHALALGSLHGAARFAAHSGQPLFVLWLDAHSDFNTPHTSPSGNLHGTPMAYVTGQSGFDAFPAVDHPVAEDNICMLGLRSVDPEEKRALSATNIIRHDMRALDESGIQALLAPFLQRVMASNGLLHVSLDVDFLDPSVAPAVGTTVPGGATVREAHLAMEMVHDSGLMRSMDLVELNPMLDEHGRTAQLMVDLCASAFGRTVFDRPTARLT